MNMDYSLAELTVCFFLYAFLGWVLRVGFVALKDRRYANAGLLDLPLSIPFGTAAMVLLLALPTLDGHPVLQFGVSWAVIEIVYRLADQFVGNISQRSTLSTEKSIHVRLSLALIHLAVYLVLHPFVFILLKAVPQWLNITAAAALTVLTMVDYFSVCRALRTRKQSENVRRQNARTQRIADKVTERIWKRLEKAYPGVERAQPQERSRYVFARGLCFDKLVWVFLISSFLGALIEMVFCFVTGGNWMNRSSLLYGSFSVVWGLGAVVLTVVLQRLAKKEDHKVFLAGALVGGVYEYLCSVFTELVFGTVFWDYSKMPLNIGGRTNVLYCIFWGILAVVWIKVLYPPMERSIENIPPVMGKILTWAVAAFMLCNALLTAGAMYRYTERRTDPEPSNILEAFLDERCTDDLMESRWPNMKVAKNK